MKSDRLRRPAARSATPSHCPKRSSKSGNIATDTPAAAPILLTKPAGADQNVVPIELFSPDAMMRFNLGR